MLEKAVPPTELSPSSAYGADQPEEHSVEERKNPSLPHTTTILGKLWKWTLNLHSGAERSKTERDLLFSGGLKPGFRQLRNSLKLSFQSAFSSESSIRASTQRLLQDICGIICTFLLGQNILFRCDQEGISGIKNTALICVFNALTGS